MMGTLIMMMVPIIHLPQLAEDVVTFLKWSAEPELEERKSLGIKVILFFIVLGFYSFFSKA